MSRSGVDCSGFVLMTMRDKFDLQLHAIRTHKIGTKLIKTICCPAIWFFLKPVWESGLHVGIYDTNNQFIHASTSRGVMRSSLDNVYWRKNFWQARRFNLTT
ncbi:NlpC/P60 family protein [Shigella flexneri]